MGCIIDGIVKKYGYEQTFVSARINNASAYYGYFSLPKKSGGYRKILVPSADLKVFQRYVLEEYYSKISISSCATAYRKGGSLQANVAPHTKNTFFLHIDIKNFFDSMNRDYFSGVLHRESIFRDFCGQDYFEILQIATFNSHFPQGAVTSPAVSNIYFKDMDVAIEEVARSLPNGVYTRYSDDITISSSSKISETEKGKIFSILKIGYLVPNLRKTYFSTVKRKIHITGLNIVSEDLSAGLKYKRLICHDLYHFLKLKDGSISFSKIKGKLEFLWSVDPKSYNHLFQSYQKFGNKHEVHALFSHSKEMDIF